MSRPLNGKTLTQEDIEGVLELHFAGWSSTKIGNYFNRDHSTIIYHLQKLRRLGIIKGKVRLQFVTRTKHILNYERPKDQYKYQSILEEKINPGKSYKQYLKEAKAREGPKTKVFYNIPSGNGHVDKSQC